MEDPHGGEHEIGHAIRAIDTSVKTTGQANAIKAAGFDAVGVYLRSDRCSAAMITELRNAGLKIWTVYEKGNPTGPGYFNAARGTADGTRAADFAQEIGQPTGTQIYAGVDYDATQSEVNGVISSYMTAFQAAVQAEGYSSSVYGSGRTCRILIAKGLAKTGWLSLSTGWAEHNAFKPNASIVQVAEISSDRDSNTIADTTKPGLW
jgi:hypothetical protein